MTRRALPWIVVATGGLCVLVTLRMLFAAPPAPPTATAGPTVEAEVYFSPGGGCSEAIAHFIQSARKTVCIQTARFTSRPLADVLINLQRRTRPDEECACIDVELIVDGAQMRDRNGIVDYLRSNGVPVLFDTSHKVAHSNIIIVDNEKIMTGSFEFTLEAESRNAENVLLFRGIPGVVGRYIDSYALHRAHSITGKGLPPMKAVPQSAGKNQRPRQADGK